MCTVAVNREAVTRLQVEHGLTAQKDFAQALGLDKSTVSRVLDQNPNRRTRPGNQFIASFLRVFPVKFEDVFDILDGEDQENAVAA